MSVTSSPKDRSLRVIQQLRDDVSYEDIMYELNLLQKVERGLRDVQEGRTTPHKAKDLTGFRNL